MSRVKQAHREFRDAPHGPFTWPSDRIKDAYASMDKTYAKMKVLEAEAESFKNLQECDLGVLRCCGAFTPSTRLVSMREGAGWSLVQI